MNQDFQIRHGSKHYRPCNKYKHRFHRSHHRSLLGGRSVKPFILSSEATLNEFNCWSKSFVAHFDSNKDYLAVASNPVKRVFITSLWDSNLQAELKANSKMVNVHAIKTDNDDPSILIWLKDFLIGYQPVYIRQ